MPGASLVNVPISSNIVHLHTIKAKTVVITGCTRGLGRAMIPVFIDAGWQVAGCGRDKSQIAKLRHQVGPPHFFDVDWARRAVPFFIQLGRKDNGRPLTVPG
jgi:NADP-dependent 3-hydroxy acid dehydrogenase YdfG